MTRRPAPWVALLAGAALGASACGGERAPAAETIRLATTTSARDTGLLDALLPAFREESGVDVLPIAVGTGEALQYGARGDADVVLVHARKAEDAFMAEGRGVERRDVWWNRFVVVGPADARVERAFREAQAPELPMASSYARPTPAHDLLWAVRGAGATFVSRGDDSGTHKRELELWAARGGRLTPWPGYLETGQGMGPTLTVADEKDAYALTDEGTFLRMRRAMRLEVVLTADPGLLNPYGAILVRPAGPRGRRFDAAHRFLEWLTGERCRSLVRSFRIDGRRVFFLPGEPASDVLAGRLDARAEPVTGPGGPR